MLTIVSGLQRSGTSMMIRCLEAGGLTAHYDDTNLLLNDEYSRPGYVPNPHGYYALQADFNDPAVLAKFDGGLIKVPYCDLIELPPGDYRVLWMQRDPLEIFASMRMFQPMVSWAAEAWPVYLYEIYVPSLLRYLEQRGDMVVATLQYAAVVTDPVGAFTVLQSQGWPIDADAAAVLVDADLYRMRSGEI